MPLCRRRETPGDGPAEHRPLARAGSASRPIRVGSYVSAAATNNPSRGEPRGRNASPRRGQGRVACAVGTPRAPSGWGRDQGGRGLALWIRQIEANFVFYGFQEAKETISVLFWNLPRIRLIEAAAAAAEPQPCGVSRCLGLRGRARPWGRRAPPAMGARDTGVDPRRPQDLMLPSGVSPTKKYGL